MIEDVITMRLRATLWITIEHTTMIHDLKVRLSPAGDGALHESDGTVDRGADDHLGVRDSHAKGGCDVNDPSDASDGIVIRVLLRERGCQRVPDTGLENKARTTAKSGTTMYCTS